MTDSVGHTDVINDKDKTGKILRLTSLGKNLMKVLNTNEDIQAELKRSIDAEFDTPTKPWWPGEGPEPTFPVKIQTFADKDVRGASEVSINTIASFECFRCEATVEHKYWVKLSSGDIAVSEWGRSITADCSCGQTYEHQVADPRTEPTPD
ncbi:hypothetical protein [Halomicrobium katesii]|uniref:hypothetical protein n=1 Tax=Halomicrobium katesii TaxID=437163 RepID=UPI0012BA8D7F|nr:hypothetical protein [Halomicrobium katesii]